MMDFLEPLVFGSLAGDISLSAVHVMPSCIYRKGFSVHICQKWVFLAHLLVPWVMG